VRSNETLLHSLSVVRFCFFYRYFNVTLTGCSEILSPGDTVTLRDTISVEKLSVPTIDSVVVLAGGKTAQIHFSGSHVRSEDFTGYYRLTTKDTLTAVVADSVILADGAAWTGRSSFTVPISRDGVQTFWIASYNKKGKFSQPVPAFVFGRDMASGAVNRFTLGSVSDGIDVDGTPEVKTVEDGIRADANPVQYATNSGCDIIVEQIGGSGTLCITPIGGAVVFKATDTAIYTKAQISQIYQTGYVDTVVAQPAVGITTFSKGRSVRDAAGLYAIQPADYFIVITSAKNVARIKVESVAAAAASATLVVYQDSGRNAGELLYKKTN
jgi:hypothetical protein